MGKREEHHRIIAYVYYIAMRIFVVVVVVVMGMDDVVSQRTTRNRLQRDPRLSVPGIHSGAVYLHTVDTV